MSEHIRFHHKSVRSPLGGRPDFTLARIDRRELPYELREQARVLGPTPKLALAALADLGLSDDEIARYHQLPRQSVSAMRDIWNIAEVF